MSEQKLKIPVLSTEALLQRQVDATQYAAHLAMNGYFAAHATPRRPIIEVWDVPSPQPKLQPQPQLQSVPELQPQPAQLEPAHAAHSVAA